jgi:hypothetical protein
MQYATSFNALHFILAHMGDPPRIVHRQSQGSLHG